MTAQQPEPGHDKAVELVRDELSGQPIGSGYYGTTVNTGEATDMAIDVVAALRAALAAGDPDVAEALGLTLEQVPALRAHDGVLHAPWRYDGTHTTEARRFVTEWAEA